MATTKRMIIANGKRSGKDKVTTILSLLSSKRASLFKNLSAHRNILPVLQMEKEGGGEDEVEEREEEQEKTGANKRDEFCFTEIPFPYN